MSTVQEFSRIGGKESGIARTRAQHRRQQQVIVLHTAGLSNAEIARRLDVSQRTVWRDLADTQDQRVRAEEIIEDCGLDATDVHITLSRMHDADLADIIVDPSAPLEQIEYKPIAQWPAIWRQGLAGKIKLTPQSVVAVDADGKTRDVTSYKIEIERDSLLRILELSAKLKAVDALSTPSRQIETDNSVTVTVNIVHVGQVNIDETGH